MKTTTVGIQPSIERLQTLESWREDVGTGRQTREKRGTENRTGVHSAGGEHAGSPESAHHPRPSQQALLKVPTRTVLVPEASGAGMSRKDSNA